MVGHGELPDELKVLRAVDVPVLHELEVLLVDTPLDGGGHRVLEHVPPLTLLNQGLGREGEGRGRGGGGREGERKGKRGRGGGRETEGLNNVTGHPYGRQ